jgi:vacuolar iron transporter family protein
MLPVGNHRAPGQDTHMARIAPYVVDPEKDAADLQAQAQRVARGGARAAVLGVNDGLVSNLCLILGVAGASASQSSVRLAGFASLIAGAASMAAGEWVSVRAQVELYGGVLNGLRDLLHRNPRLVVDRLSVKLQEIGLDTSTSKLASSEMGIEEDRLLDFAARNVLGVDPDETGSPLRCCCSPAGAFVPLLPWFFTSGGAGVWWSSALTTVAAAGVGAWISWSSGRPLWRGAARQIAIVVFASAATYVIGKAFGTAIA